MWPFGSKTEAPPGRHNAALRRELATQLRSIPSSHDGHLECHPCRAALDDGRRLDCVYVVDVDAYVTAWGVWPEDDPGKCSVRIEHAIAIEESPLRLSAPLTNRLYESGESGMGYCVFSVALRDGTRQACVTGNAVGFITVPPGRKGSDAVQVIPHDGRDRDPRPGPDYAWRLYRGRERDA